MLCSFRNTCLLKKGLVRKLSCTAFISSVVWIPNPLPTREAEYSTFQKLFKSNENDLNKSKECNNNYHKVPQSEGNNKHNNLLYCFLQIGFLCGTPWKNMVCHVSPSLIDLNASDLLWLYLPHQVPVDQLPFLIVIFSFYLYDGSVSVQEDQELSPVNSVVEAHSNLLWALCTATKLHLHHSSTRDCANALYRWENPCTQDTTQYGTKKLWPGIQAYGYGIMISKCHCNDQGFGEVGQWSDQYILW